MLKNYSYSSKPYTEVMLHQSWEHLLCLENMQMRVRLVDGLCNEPQKYCVRFRSFFLLAVQTTLRR